MEFSSKTKATQMLWEDHSHVRELYREMLDKPDSSRTAAAFELLKELEIHALLEEHLVYPELVIQNPDQEDNLVRSFSREHGEVRRLISEFRACQDEASTLSPASLERLNRMMTLVQHHVLEEEQKSLPILAANTTRDEELGTELVKLKRKLEMFPPVYKRMDVGVPIGTAYNQWTQFEDFPFFMENVKRVRQLDDSRLQWLAEVSGKEIEWASRIYEQIPDQRIAWTSVEGPLNAGCVSFQALGPNTTRVLVEVTYEPQGLLENLGALVGTLSRRVAGDLARFKEFMERNLKESGAWRGQIEGTPVDPDLPPPPSRDRESGADH